jgi:DNA-binding transcriptional LysR family regulator
MNLRQLRYFATVAEELHFGRAARKLAISQPPLSQQIIALEQEMGVQLFVRTKRSVALTPVARQWLPEVERLLKDAADLPGKARRLSRGEIGTLSIAFVSTADYSVLPVLLRNYSAKFPEVEVRLREATSDVQIDALLNEEIDLGIAIPPRGSKLPRTLSYLPLQRERLILALPEHWARRKSRVDFEQLADSPLIVFPRASAPALHDAITDYYASRKVVPRFGQEAIQMQTIVSLVSAGMGIALVPHSLRKLQRAGVVYRELSGRAPEIETGLIWRKEAMSAALAAFLQLAKPSPVRK